MQLWEGMRRIWPIPSNKCLVNTGEEWLLSVLANCTKRVRDMVLILIWRVWNLRTDLLHGNDQVPVKISVELLNSYLNSLWHAKKYNTEKMIKGKMVEGEGWSEPKNKETVLARPWPAPAAGWVTLSVDSSFSSDGTAGLGMVLRNPDGGIHGSIFIGVILLCGSDRKQHDIGEKPDDIHTPYVVGSVVCRRPSDEASSSQYGLATKIDIWAGRPDFLCTYVRSLLFLVFFHVRHTFLKGSNRTKPENSIRKNHQKTG